MVIELSWTITADGLREARCCMCRGSVVRGGVEAHLVSDSDRLHLGEVCPKCIGRGARYIEARTLHNLQISVMMGEATLRMEKRALAEILGECPTHGEDETLKARVGGPRATHRRRRPRPPTSAWSGDPAARGDDARTLCGRRRLA